MKFLLIVLALHFIAELIGNKRKDKSKAEPAATNDAVIHPAEFDMR